MDNIKVLIIPDIHGRVFWKEAVENFPRNKYPKLDIVFLGDYVDPYDHEGISRRDAIENFEEIIEFAKTDNRVHLLIGNHDMHYWYDAEYKSRCDFDNYDEINKLFIDNFDLFNIAYECNINDKKYLFTHAGVSKPWLDHLRFIGDLSMKIHLGKMKESQIPFCEMLKEMTPDANKLNEMKSNSQGQHNLWCVGWVRGGNNNCGSCIWEDLSEWMYEGMEIPGIWQIFGHSRWSKEDPEDAYISERGFACVDTASAWELLDNGKLIKFNHKKERFKKYS